MFRNVGSLKLELLTQGKKRNGGNHKLGFSPHTVNSDLRLTESLIKRNALIRTTK